MRLILLALLATGCGEVPARTEASIATVPPPSAACTEQWVHMPFIIRFAEFSAEPFEGEGEPLDELVAAFHRREDVRRVRVEGHVDSCGAEGDVARLGERRAVAIAELLSARGIPREQIETVSYGGVRGSRSNEYCPPRGADFDAQQFSRVEFSLLVCR